MQEYEDGVKMTKISDTDNNSCSSNTDSMEFQQTGNQSPALQHVSNWIGAGSHHEDQNQQSREVVVWWWPTKLTTHQIPAMQKKVKVIHASHTFKGVKIWEILKKPSQGGNPRLGIL